MILNPKFSYSFFLIKIIFILIIVFQHQVFSQNYETSNTQDVYDSKIIGKKIFNGDTIWLLAKKCEQKLIDFSSSTLYGIGSHYILPDSLPDGKYGAYYDEKKQNLKFIVQYKNKEKNGPFQFFYRNKILLCTGFYKNNCLDKIYIKYSNKGIITSVSNYLNGQLNGVSIIFGSDGKQFYSYTSFIGGKREGPFLQYKYDENGFPIILYDFEYKNDERMNK
jgi:antitoxin component YwqK of YwqJK toxin-antitoxin module